MNTERTSGRDELERRARRHAALGDPSRLAVVDLLELGDLSVAELREALALPSNLLAHHLNVLEGAGVVRRRRSEGDGRRTYVSLVASGGAPGPAHGVGWSVGDGGARAAVPGADRVVFVCTANTARSHLAAALWRAASEVSAVSAGTHPEETIAPGAVGAARRHGLDLPEVAPRQVEGLLRPGDLVVTVCDRAHEEFAGDLHWSVPDPVRVGTEEAFDAAHDALRLKVGALATALVPATCPA